MEMTDVPGTGLHVSRLVLGTMTFGSQADVAEAATMMDACRDAGINMIDTANVYNGGTSEEILGRLLKGRRDAFILATKAGMPSEDAAGHPPLSRAAIRSCLEASLRRLGTDYVDVFYLHQPDRSTPIEETLGAVADAVRAGSVRHLGVSNHSAWQIAELGRVARESGFPVPVLSQPLYNLLARRIEDEYVEYAATAGLVNIVYNPLGGGLLTGKHHFDQAPDAAGRFGTSGLGPMYRQRYWDRRLMEAVEAFREVAARGGLTLVELAFRWLLGRPAVGAILLGASRTEQLRANLDACAGPPLDEDTVIACDEIWQRLHGPAPAYNR